MDDEEGEGQEHIFRGNYILLHHQVFSLVQYAYLEFTQNIMHQSKLLFLSGTHFWGYSERLHNKLLIHNCRSFLSRVQKFDTIMFFTSTFCNYTFWGIILNGLIIDFATPLQIFPLITKFPLLHSNILMYYLFFCFHFQQLHIFWWCYSIRSVLFS